MPSSDMPAQPLAALRNAAQRRSLVLASASPRRREILGQLGVEFRVVPSGIDETALPGETPEQHVVRLADEKASEVAQRFVADEQRPLVLAADTIVIIDGEVLGKPAHDADAVRMLLALGGRTHRVMTALCLREARGAHREAFALTTLVRFRPLDARVARAYVASGEGRDKAGSYAIQGLGAGLVAAIEGSYTNVVGLPAVETLAALMRAGVIDAWP
jgi:septum formation protein